MKTIKEADKWIRDENAKIDKLQAERDRVTDVDRIRGDFIDCEKNMYPLQFHNLWKPI